MESRIVFEVILILVMIVINGIFAMSEIAVVSARKARLQQRAEQGDLGAAAALQLAESPNRFLSAVQIGITLIGIFAGAFGGATLAEEIAHAIGVIPAMEPYSEAIGVAVVVLATTYLSLVIGELVPKRLALNNPERTAALVARPMILLSRLTSPVVSLLTYSSDLLLRLLRAQASSEPQVTEEEISLLIEQGIHEGVFHQAEHEIIERVFALDDRRVNELMTPRPDVIWVNVSEPPEVNLTKVMESGHAYFPAVENSLDHLLGMITAKSILAALIKGDLLDLRSLVIPALYVPQSVGALKLLNTLRENKCQIALIIDEFGGFQGLVTLNDIVESVMGGLPSLASEVEAPAILQREDGSWLVDGQVHLHDLERELDMMPIPLQGRITYHTVGGFVMASLGRIPAVSDHFEAGGHRFEVVDMDGHRVDKVLITRR